MRVYRLPRTCEFLPCSITASTAGPGFAGVVPPKQHQRGIVRAFTVYCLTLRREILFPLGWFGSSAMQMTRRSPYRQSERSGVA
jgi:hypothetical protein